MTTLSILKNNPQIYQQLEEKGILLKTELGKVLTEKGIPHTINHCGSMISVHFGEHKVKDFETAAACDIPTFNKYFHHMLNHGIYLPPSAYESWFFSDSLSQNDIEKAVAATKDF